MLPFDPSLSRFSLESIPLENEPSSSRFVQFLPLSLFFCTFDTLISLDFDRFPMNFAATTVQRPEVKLRGWRNGRRIAIRDIKLFLIGIDLPVDGKKGSLKY